MSKPRKPVEIDPLYRDAINALCKVQGLDPSKVEVDELMTSAERRKFRSWVINQYLAGNKTPRKPVRQIKSGHMTMDLFADDDDN